MNKHIFLFTALAVITLLASACGGVSEPQADGAAASSGSPVGDTPAPPVASRALETATAAPTPVETATTAPTPTETADTGTSEVVGNSGEAASGGLTLDPQALMDQVLSSPEVMSCLTAKVGMLALMQMVSRGPTDEEIALLLPCLEGLLELDADFDGGTSFAAQWRKRIDAALAPTTCGSPSQNNYPSSYYSGPLIDSHLHIPPLPDDGFGEFEPPEDSTGSGGVDSALYDSIAEEDVPFLGRTVTIGDIVCSLQNEGSIRAFAFFPVYEDIQVHQVEVAARVMEQYPSLFVPFIQSSGSEVSTVEADLLQEWLQISPDLFFGLGEVGDSPTEPINPPPDSVIYTENFEVARDHNLAVYFHTGVGHHENMARALERFPDITFIVHGDFVRPHIDDLMDRYPNIYFTFNDIFDEVIPLFRFGNKEDFISAMEREWDSMLEQALELYRPMIEAHPDRYMWGTDRADIAWNYDEDLGKLLADYGRAFISNFDPDIQEKIAYKNAERLIAEGNNP